MHPVASPLGNTIIDVMLLCSPRSITQAIEADAYIRLNGLALNTEEIVGVSQEQWTVKPAHTKRLIAPGDTTSTTAGSHITASERTQSTGVVVPAYICRPSHRQPPHTGILHDFGVFLSPQNHVLQLFCKGVQKAAHSASWSTEQPRVICATMTILCGGEVPACCFHKL